jgi:hypothetical protein
MAYLNEENSELYSRMLSADTEQGPKPGGIFSPGPKMPKPTTPSVFTKMGFGKPPGAMATKGITVTGTTLPGSGGGNTEIAPTPKSFVQATTTIIKPKKSNIMPLVYIGGAGLLLYYLFKK